MEKRIELREDNRQRIVTIIGITLIVIIIINLILYLAWDRYTFINWEYVYTPEKADRF